MADCIYIIVNCKPLVTRSWGRPRKRWKEEVEMDMRKKKSARWKEITEDRRVWRNIVEQAKSHPGVYSPIRTRIVLYVLYNPKTWAL